MQKKSLWKALLFSALICLAGGIVWGLVYSLGYMVYIVAFATVVLAGGIYRKFYKFNFAAFIWIVLLSIIFNEIATILAINLEIVNEIMPQLSFARGMEILFELIRTNEEVKTAIISDTIFNVLAVLIGGVVAWVSIIRQEKKSASNPHIKVNKPTTEVVENSTISEKPTEKKDGIQLYYTNMKSAFRSVIEAYRLDKDREGFKTKISTLKAQYVDKLGAKDKARIRALVESELNQEGLKNLDKAILSTILKLF